MATLVGRDGIKREILKRRKQRGRDIAKLRKDERETMIKKKLVIIEG